MAQAKLAEAQQLTARLEASLEGRRLADGASRVNKMRPAVAKSPGAQSGRQTSPKAASPKAGSPKPGAVSRAFERVLEPEPQEAQVFEPAAEALVAAKPAENQSAWSLSRTSTIRKTVVYDESGAVEGR